MGRNRLIFLAGLAAAGLALVMYALIFHPQKSSKNKVLTREARELQEANALLQREIETWKKALADAAGKGFPVYARSSGGFREQASQIIAGVDRLVHSTGVNLVRLEPQPREQRGALAIYPFLLEVRGSFYQMVAFLRGLENELLLVPNLFTLEAGAKASEGIRASLRLAAHEWLGQQLEPRAVKKSGAALLSSPGRRDPFALPGLAPGLEHPRVQGPVLTGILMIGGKAKAIIDGKTYSPGDVVAGKKILAITQEEVVLEGEDKPLRINRPLRKVGPS